jgi:hypothetical protein
MIKIVKPFLAALAAVALVLGLGACASDNHGTDGRPGKVIDRDSDPSYTTGSKSHKVHHSADYDLQVDPADGSGPYWIDVGNGVYDHCYRGSSYPKCADK